MSSVQRRAGLLPVRPARPRFRRRRPGT